jgi:L-amino acid N-acyltransferase YncA
VHVRRARPEDAAAIARVHTEAWQAAYEHVFGAERLATIDVAEREQRWRARLEAPEDAVVLVSEQEGAVTGFAVFGASRDEDTDAADGEVHGIYVHPSRWGAGEGRALLAAALDGLRARGFRDATLWVLDDNPRARRFYEREGWRLVDGKKHDTFFDIEITELRYRVRL